MPEQTSGRTPVQVSRLDFITPSRAPLPFDASPKQPKWAVGRRPACSPSTIGQKAWPGAGNGICCTLLTGAGGSTQGPRLHKRWAMEEVVAVHHARYLLRPTALEIFMSGRKSALLAFPSAQVQLPAPICGGHQLPRQVPESRPFPTGRGCTAQMALPAVYRRACCFVPNVQSASQLSSLMRCFAVRLATF